MKVVYPREQWCIACNLCEVACMTEHSISRDPLKMYLTEKPRPLSRTKVEYLPPVAVSIMCRHCAEAECVEACKNGTLTRDEKTGRVELDQDKCLGCWMCIMACPYGAISQFTLLEKATEEANTDRGRSSLTGFTKNERAVANKCDLCPEREMPACVAVCPNRALVFEDRG
jgi:anaerobic carbon-monoxide dehydrogenase iron sulfur subunit